VLSLTKTDATRAETLEDVNNWAKPQGYTFSNAPSRKKGNERRKVIFACDRREPKKEERPQKEKGEGHNRSGQSTQCKYSIICIENVDKTGWEIRYRKNWIDPKTNTATNFCTHDHPPSSGTGAEHAVHHAQQLEGERWETLVKSVNF
jgi:hypothetical protein